MKRVDSFLSVPFSAVNGVYITVGRNGYLLMEGCSVAWIKIIKEGGINRCYEMVKTF